MATIFRTSEGDLLDSLCHAYYGHLLGTVEAVMEANPGLAEEVQPFRAGVLISFPELAAAEAEQVTLWD